MYQAQMLDLYNGNINLGTFDTEEEARNAIRNYRASSGQPNQAARIIVPSEFRYYFV